jgi:hypothetical protein
MVTESTRDGVRVEIAGGVTLDVVVISPPPNGSRGGGAMLRRRLAVLAVATLAALGMLTLPSSAAQSEALIRLAHFVPELPKGDIYVVYLNGRLQFKGVPFKTVSDYLKVKPGQYRIEVRAAGEPAASPAALSVTVKLQSGRAYTAAVFGQLTSLKAVLLNDDLSRPGSGGSKVRLIQAIPGDQAVDLAAGGDVLFSGARFPSASDYQEVPAGRVEVEVRKSGSTDLLVPARQVNLKAGSTSSLILVGSIGEQLELLDVPDSAASAVAPASGVATGAGGTAPSGIPSLVVPAALVAALLAGAGFMLQRRRSSG